MCARTRSCTNSPGGCSKTEWRDADEEPKLYLFGQLKQITRRWLGSHLVCTGRAFPVQLMYRELADRACERIHQGIVSRHEGDRPVKAMLDPTTLGLHRRRALTTSKTRRWKTTADLCHVNWAVCDSDWELEFCRVAESDPESAPT